MLRLLFFLLVALISCDAFSQKIKIENHPGEKFVTFGNEKIQLTLDYNGKANISSMVVNGQEVIHGDTGIYSSIKIKQASHSTLRLATDPVLNFSGNTITLSNIEYGSINETWKFTVGEKQVSFDIERNLPDNIIAEKTGFPAFTFSSINTWEGAYQDYGGLAWFYLFNRKLDTYGVHSHSSDFWNSKTGNGLTVAVSAPGNQVALDYSRTNDDKLSFGISPSQHQMIPRFDSGTYRRRYVRDTADVWAPFEIAAGKTHQTITLSYFDFNEKYGRGKMPGINGGQVSAVLNTIARIGVIDKQQFGGNSWHTPYGPICLHEQYIAQMGVGIDDTHYLEGYRQCLDFYRDNAIKPDGRVWPRWAYSNEDAMPNQFTDKGFYEAQWGYLLDANPDFVTNVAELYDQNGDLAWVKTQQSACEKALDWIIKRDSDNDGLVEMINDSYKQKRGSDWIDIIWAAHENAFVNAKLYYALTLWADIEGQLGNERKHNDYQAFAAKLKESFNKPVSSGGFWDDDKKCYIHWRDKDGSVHGNNMVTPVNFMAIAYGICDNAERTKSILDAIETQMEKENLFFWPICLYSYAPGEGNDWQFPFPNYENGDLFLSWGSIAVKCYASYKPELALKYVKAVLARYAADGLAFQRYGRAKQDGLGDDILSGNSLSIVGLYKSIYGINPRYNRFYLDPHITPELTGTALKYNYRGKKLHIDLAMNKYAVSDGRFKIISATDFGFFSTGNKLSYFNRGDNMASLEATTASKTLTLEMRDYGREKVSFLQAGTVGIPNKAGYRIYQLLPNTTYSVLVNDKELKKQKSTADGILQFEVNSGSGPREIVIVKR
jgi:hypothetical protein